VAVTGAHCYLTINFPLTEEIRLKIFASGDLTILSLCLLSDGDSIYKRENLYDLGTPMKTCLGTPGKPVGNFGSRNYLNSDLLRLWDHWI